MRYQSVWLVAAEGDDAFVAHLRQMLRQRRLADRPTASASAPTVASPAFHQLAQDHQPPLVGERAKDVGDLAGLGLEVREIESSELAIVMPLHIRYC